MNWTEYQSGHGFDLQEYQSECTIANITFALLFPGYWLFRILQLKKTSVVSRLQLFVNFKKEGDTW